MIEGRRSLFVGESGGGKTYLAKLRWLARLRERAAAGELARGFTWDPKCEWNFSLPVRSRADMLRQFQSGARVITVRSYDVIDWEPIEEFSSLVAAIDEAHNIMIAGTSATSIRPSARRMLSEGRSRGIDMLIMIQRARRVNGEVWTSINEAYLYPIQYGSDRACVEENLAVQLPAVSEWKSFSRPGGTSSVPFLWRRDRPGVLVPLDEVEPDLFPARRPVEPAP